MKTLLVAGAAMFALFVGASAALTACGTEDRPGTNEDDFGWFSATSPHGVALDCIGYGEAIWCMEVPGP